MRLVRSLFAILAAVLVTAVAWEAQAQQVDPYVSCVRCHALPMPQAQAQMQQHGSGYPPTPEQACAYCHDTLAHEQDPSFPPYQPYFWPYPLTEPVSLMTNLCLSCHSVPIGNHPYDVFPYFGTPLDPAPIPPTSVLPLFEANGWPNQNPNLGGIVCSTCHDPHDPSYFVNGSPKFLRIGSFEQIAPLCGYCHDQGAPPTTGDDLFIPSDSDSVRFELMPAGDLRIDVTVRNRGNAYSSSSADVFWEDETGYRWYIGQLPLFSIPPDGETVVPVFWMPPPQWVSGEGFFVFWFPPRLLVESSYPVEFVRSMNVPPPPANVRVTSVTSGEIALEWDPPLNLPPDLGWEIYRDGVKVTPAPIPYSPYGIPTFVDGGLAPATPHVYQVVAVSMGGGLASQPSDPVGGTTSAAAAILRVPQDVPTIQQAIDMAAYGTLIQVAPGTYTEPLNFANAYGITVRGQDANGCVLDYTAAVPSGPAVDLGAAAGQPGNTLAGFTVRNGWIRMGAGDVLAECVIVADAPVPPVVSGGGLVAHCIFDTTTQYAFHIEPDQFLTSVNSVYFGSQPFAGYLPPADTTLLLNNDFPSWYGWIDYDGSGNFTDWPLFAAPGPPQEYLPDPWSPTVGRGLPLDMYAPPPNVGAFQPWQPYTPQPASGLAAAIVPEVPARVRLTWIPSVDDPARMFEYFVYRSESPTFPSGTPSNWYASVPAGQFSFEDQNVAPGITYYYQVRAYAGPGPEGTELLSAPTSTVSVTWANTPPVAVDDTLMVDEETPGTVAVLANDTDPDVGDVLTVTAVTAPQYGAAYLNPDSTVTYIPSPGYAGSDAFSYTVTDSYGATATAGVVVTVVNLNVPPVATNDAYETLQNTPLPVPPPGVLGNDTDPDGDPIAALLVNPPAHGSLTLNLDGSFSYSPNPGFTGVDAFTYFAADPWIASPVATVTITVTPANNPPVADGQALTTAEDTAAPVTLSATDVDGDALTFALVSLPAHGSLAGDAPNLTYTPAPDYFGSDSFTFTASDGQTTTPAATVSITVNAVNDPPSFVMGPDVTVNEDADVQTVAAWATAIDDGEPVGSQGLTFTVTNDSPALFSLQPSISRDGTLTFAAPTNAYGTATLTVTLTDDVSAGGAPITTEPRTFTITVLPVNDPPWARAVSVTAPEDTPTAVTLTATDTEGDGLTYAVVQTPAHGTLSGTGPFLTYTPAANYSGPDSFTYVANDGQADSNVATVTISITPVNDPPIATDQAWTATEDTVRTATAPGILQYATDIDDFSLTAVLVQGTAHGSLTLNADGSFVYTPVADYNGADSFTYRASDGQALSDVATITITVAAVNDAPVAVDQSYATAEDTQLVVAAPGLLGGATDVDSPVVSGGPRTSPSHGVLQWESDGSFRYMPAANFSGTDSFTYRVSDGWLNSADRTVTITVIPVNDAPVASAQAASTAEQTAIAVTLAATDVDGDALSFAVASGPAHGTLSGVAPNLSYAPAADYFGPDSFTFTANDGLATSAPATVSLTVTPVNDPPQANDDTTATAAYVPVLIAVLGNDTDVDGDTLSVGSATPGANGSTAVQAGGSILYRPNPGFTGTDSFSYVVNDGSGGSDTAAVTVSVRPQKLRITALTMGTVTGSRYTNATATPLAVDEAGAPVDGVSVAGRWSGLTSDADVGVTGVDGTATVSSDQVRNARGTFSFTIDAAAKDGYELDGPASVLTNVIQYPAPPPPGGAMHVASIAMGLKTGKNTSATATVSVVDANGVPVASAAVSGSWSGAVGGTATGTTGADGNVTLSSAGIKNAGGATFTFTVTGMTNSGWTYDPAANVESADSITAP